MEMRVIVRSYVRFRFGRVEHVCAHTRRWPKPRKLAFQF